MGNTVIHVEKNMGITQALKRFVKEQNMVMSDGYISSSELKAAMDKIDEIQDKRQTEGKESIFRGGRQRGAGTDWHKNYVVDEGDLSFTEDEINSIYKALGVSFGGTPNTDLEPAPDVTSEQPTDTVEILPPVVSEEPDSTTEVDAKPTTDDAAKAETGKKKPNWTAIGLGVVAAVGLAATAVSHGKIRVQGKQIAELGNKVQGLEGKVSGLETTVKDLGTKFQGLEGKVNNLKTTVNNVQTTVNNVQNTVNNVQNTVNNVQNTVNNINVTNIEQNVTNVINRQFGAKADELNEIIRNGKETLGDATKKGLGEILGATQKATKDVGHSAGEAINRIRQEGGSQVEAISQATKEAKKEVGHSAGKAISKIRQETKKLANTLFGKKDVVTPVNQDAIIGEAKSRIAAEKRIEEARKMQDEIADLMLNPSKKSAKESFEVFEANAKQKEEILIDAMNKKNREISSILNNIENNHTGATAQEIREAVRKAEEAAKAIKPGTYEYADAASKYLIEIGKDGKPTCILQQAGSQVKEMSPKKYAKFMGKHLNDLKLAIAA